MTALFDGQDWNEDFQDGRPAKIDNSKGSWEMMVLILIFGLK